MHAADDLLRRASETRWREVLEKVCALVKENGGKLDGLIPQVDYGRIRRFVAFWGLIPKKVPKWLRATLNVLTSALIREEYDEEDPYVA